MSGPLLVFGAGGQVGCELIAAAQAAGVSVVGLTRANADITDPHSIQRSVDSVGPRLIVNCAGYTAVDRAEAEPKQAAAINTEGAGLLAQAADRAAIPILHISTDYVFDGLKVGAYKEEDATAPQSVYGKTKADGEARVRLVSRHIILRTAWVYGRYGTNFLKTMLRLADERDRLRVVADQHGCPTATQDIAAAILAVDQALTRNAVPFPFGTYHFAGRGVTTWHEFAQAIVAFQAARTGRHLSVEPIPTTAYPTPARRPANSELNSGLFAETFGYRAAPWMDRARDIIDVLLGSKSSHQRRVQ